MTTTGHSTTPRRPGPRPTTAILQAGAGAAAAAAALVACGGALPFPTDAHPTALMSWARSVGPAVACFTGLRALGWLLLAWLVLTGALGVVTRRLRLASATAVLDRLSLPVVRRFANAVAGAAVVAASLAPAAAAGATPASPPRVAMVDLGPVVEGPEPVAPASPAPGAPGSTLDPRAPAPALVDLGPTPAAPPAPAPPTGPNDTTTWTVAPGDTLWHVAESTLTQRLGRRPSEAETAEALTRLVAANADRLVVAGDPDLVFPGQQFVVP